MVRGSREGLITRFGIMLRDSNEGQRKLSSFCVWKWGQLVIGYLGNFYLEGASTEVGLASSLVKKQ